MLYRLIQATPTSNTLRGRQPREVETLHHRRRGPHYGRGAAIHHQPSSGAGDDRRAVQPARADWSRCPVERPGGGEERPRRQRHAGDRERELPGDDDGPDGPGGRRPERDQRTAPRRRSWIPTPPAPSPSCPRQSRRARWAAAPATQTFDSSLFSPSLTSPDNMFGLLREELGRLADRIDKRQQDDDRRTELLNADAVDLAGAAAPCRRRGACATIRSAGARSATRASTSRPTGATRCTPPATARSQSAGWNGDYGNMVVIDHGLRARHALRAPVGVRGAPGRTRDEGAGDRAGRRTGRATGPHLHYELLVNGQLTNPLSLIGGSRQP